MGPERVPEDQLALRVTVVVDVDVVLGVVRERVKLGPPAGSWKGTKSAMTVVVSGLSGLTNAYRSVLSYCGCPEISGASRWEEAEAAPGSSAVTPAVASPPAASAPQMRAARLPRPTLLLEKGVMPSVLSANLPDARGFEWWPRWIGHIRKLISCLLDPRFRQADP